MDLAFHVPVNPVSFGQVSWNLLYELFQRGETPSVFVRDSEANLSAFKKDEAFASWLHERMVYGMESHTRDAPCLKLWHISGLMSSPSKDAYSFTFHETDSVTPVEENILINQERVFVSSSYTKKVFEEAGLPNVIYCPLGFDSHHFKEKPEKEYMGTEIISFGLRGKLEKRKHTLKILQAWNKRFGNDARFRLDCSIYNPFIDKGQQEALLVNALGGEKPFNINFLGHQAQNLTYNDCLNAVDVDLTGMSGCEGFNLPCFQSLCLGKRAIVLNAHVHKDFANEKNAILVEPNEEMIEADDGVFFSKGQKFNQGKWFDFDEDKLIEAFEKVLPVAKERNVAGAALTEEFTYARTLDTILAEI